MRWLIVLVASCGWLPPDSPRAKPAPADPDIATLAHTWIVANHVLAGNATVGDPDADANHGRKLVVTATGYDTPFSGACDEAALHKRDRLFADLIAQLDLAGEARATAIRFGFGDPITEYQLSCIGNRRAIPFTIFISGDRAMTCFGGACYLLTWK